MTTCSVEDCDRPTRTGGLCLAHYTRHNRGLPLDSTPVRPLGLSVEERFWRKVDKTGNCWTWTASTFAARMGYGKFQAGTGRADSRVVYAHRFAWELAHGPVADGLFVLHRCDNPPCVRPDHLFLGDHAENMRDMADKGRWDARGNRATANAARALSKGRAASS